MSRKKTDTAEYFPHFAKGGKTLFMLESKYGNDGYSFWFKFLEILSTSEKHYFDLSNEDNFDFLLAKTKVSTEIALRIIMDLCKWKNFDKELWETYQIIWCQDLVDNLRELYKSRKREMPLKPCFSEEKANPSVITPGEIPHSIVEYSIEEESIEEERKEENSKEAFDSKNESLHEDISLDEKSKEEKEKISGQKEKSLYEKVNEIYDTWIISKTGVPAKFNGAEGNASKQIIAYLKTASKEKTDEGVLNSWKHLLSSWDKVDPFYQEKLKLVEINSNMVNLINQIKNGRAKTNSTDQKSREFIDYFAKKAG